MAKIIYLSPQKLARQFKSWLWPSASADFSFEDHQVHSLARKEPDTMPEEENNRFQISIDDMQMIQFSLQHFQKYLKAKGKSQRAEEVATLYDRISQFITYRQENEV